MDKRKAVKVEDLIRSWSFSDYFLQSNYPNTGLLDLSNEGGKNSLGFMELMGIQDFGSSTFDMLQVPLPSSVENPDHNQTSKVVPESSKVLNQPTTPNSSSISSASTAAPNDDQTKAVEGDEEEEEQQKTKKQGCGTRLKPQKKSPKRQKEPRFAFMTKSEVDHLEDGYRWRKYGQKAVKNSPFPRSYYRCTTTSCNVKKRVERCLSDPSIVVTTYEGQHTHHSPVMHRPSPAGFRPGSGITAGAAAAFSPQLQMTFSHQPLQLHNSTPLNCVYMTSTNPTAISLNERGFCSTPASALLGDHGLLQDIVPSIMKKEK